MLAPAAGRPWRDAWPLVAQTDDGNLWGTGVCWLYCRREDLRVLWVGSVNTPGATGDVYACGPCLVELDRMCGPRRTDGTGPVIAPRGRRGSPCPLTRPRASPGRWCASTGGPRIATARPSAEPASDSSTCDEPAG